MSDWYQSYPENVPHSITHLPGITCIADRLKKTCERFGDAPAITCMGATISYRQLDRLSDRFANYLQNHAKLKKGDRIAIMLPNIMQFPIAFMAAQKLGLVCVSTNPLYTPREMEHQFKNSESTAIVILDLFLDKLEKIIGKTSIKTVISAGIGDQLPLWKGVLLKNVLRAKGLIPKHGLPVQTFKRAVALGASGGFTAPKMAFSDLAILQYTGGTTGLSKGAMLTQENILSNMAQINSWAEGKIHEGDENVLTALPLYHIFALSVNFLTFLSMGCHMFLVPKPIPIKNTIKMFKKYKLNVVTGVNTLFNAMNHDQEFKRLAPKTVKIALAGGMALQDSVSKEFQKITGIPITEGFGLTEASPVTHCNPLFVPCREGSCGLPLPSTFAKVVDDEGKETAHGEVGELIIKGPQVMKGYWNCPEETAKTIRDGWLWTGDIAKRDADGFFYIVDRKKDMILVSGFNVYPNEVEEVLASHPKVLEAAVIGITNPKSGESVKAFVVKKDQSLTEEELRRYCEENLTNYKRPRAYEFRTELPKTNVGKILRRELRPDTPNKN